MATSLWKLAPGANVVRISGDVDNLMPDAWTGASIRALRRRGAPRDEYPDFDPSYTMAEQLEAPYDPPEGRAFDVER
jgi:hypothetical protein